MSTPPTIDAAMCERFVSAAARSCPAISAPTPVATVAAPQPEWDALANSFASLSNAFAFGSILLALIAIVAAIGWGYLVKKWAEEEAQKEATECVKRMMDKWLAEEAPQIIRKNVEYLQNTSLGPGDDDRAADEMGKEAG